MRFYRNVFRLSHAGHAFLSECLALDHACCLPPVRQTERLAGCFVPIPPWVEIAGSAFSLVVRLSRVVGSFRDCAFLYGDPDGGRKGRGERSRRRGRVRFCANVLALKCFPRGVRWGLNVEAALRPPPNLRQRAIGSLDSLHLIRGVGAFYAAGTVREHSAVSWRCRQLPRRRLSASSPRAGTAPRPDNTPQPFRRRCTPHAQPARRRGSATAQRPRRTARLP